MEQSEPVLLPKVGERLWLDDSDAFKARQATTNDPLLIEHAQHLREHGFVHLKGVVSEAMIDKAVAAYKQWCENLDGDPRTIRGDGRNPRVVNLHGDRDEFKSLFTSSPDFLRVLDYLMGYRASVYTSLTFEFGTEQPLHRDTPVFRTEPEEFYYGVWFALEDADERNGCLQVLKGGHKDGRVDPFEFAMSHNVGPEDIVPSAGPLWAPYQNALVAKCREEGCPLELLPAKKGDVIIWHPQLPHGGSSIKNPDRTRMSTVYHVVPEGVPVYQADVFFNPGAKPERKSNFKYTNYDGREFVQKVANVGKN